MPDSAPATAPAPAGDDELPFVYPEPPVTRKRGRPRKNAAPAARPIADSITVAAFISAKETTDWTLALQLRHQGKITTPGDPFEQSDALEIDGLMNAEVLKPEMYNPLTHGNIRIFKSRMVREVKGKNTTAPCEKSRLVVQGYGDEEKKTLLTQAPTIQRCSQ